MCESYEQRQKWAVLEIRCVSVVFIISYLGGSANVVWPSDAASSLSPRSYLTPSSSGSTDTQLRRYAALSQPSKCRP